MKLKNILLASIATLSLGMSAANAQTVLSSKAPGKTTSTQSPAQSGVMISPVPTAPLPENVIEQAKEQHEGFYTQMARSAAGMPLGQIQNAWNPELDGRGAHRYDHCGDCVYKIVTREHMMTTIVLPKSTVITEADLGDPRGFTAKVRAANIIAIRPQYVGLDTNLNVYTQSGEVFAFYIRAEGVHSDNIPDIIVRINADPVMEAIRNEALLKEKQQKEKEKAKAAAPLNTLIPPQALEDLKPIQKEGEEDYAQRLEFDPASLHGWEDYKLWGDEELRPEMVFRDKQFTYIQFGSKWDQIELPTAYVVIDDIDELVNTRVQGRTYIIENTAPLITLKSGKKFICLEFTGESV